MENVHLRGAGVSTNMEKMHLMLFRDVIIFSVVVAVFAIGIIAYFAYSRHKSNQVKLTARLVRDVNRTRIIVQNPGSPIKYRGIEMDPTKDVRIGYLLGHVLYYKNHRYKREWDRAAKNGGKPVLRDIPVDTLEHSTTVFDVTSTDRDFHTYLQTVFENQTLYFEMGLYYLSCPIQCNRHPV